MPLRWQFEPINAAAKSSDRLLSCGNGMPIGMKAGAIDFLTKPIRDQDLLDAVAVAIRTDQRRRQEFGQIAELRERYADRNEGRGDRFSHEADTRSGSA